VHCLPAVAGEWTNAFTATRGDKMMMWPLAKLLWTPVYATASPGLLLLLFLLLLLLFLCRDRKDEVRVIFHV